MSFVTWKLERTPFKDNKWDTDLTEELTSYYDPILQVELGDSRDTFSFKVTNVNGRFSDYFHAQDKIVISRAINTGTVVATDILMTGAVQDVPEEVSFNQSLVRVEGYNFTEAVMSALVFVDAENLTIPQAFQQALNSVNAFNPNFTVTWKSTNPSVRSDGSAFPIVGSKFYYKPLRDLFEKYSTNTATGDGLYFWYVNSNNELVWQKQTSAIARTFNSSTDSYQKLKFSKDAKDVVNFVIVKGGLDPANNPIQDRYMSLASIAKHGQRYKVIPDITANAKTIVAQDLKTQNKNDAKDLSYPFTTTWTTVLTENGDGYSISGGHIIAADYDGYVQAVRDHIKKRCRQEGEAYVELYKYGKLKVDITVSAGGLGWLLGEVVSVTIPSLGTGSKLMRVRGIQYTTTSDTFTLVEDTGSV